MINSNNQSKQDNLILLLSEKEKVCLNSFIFNSSSRNEAYKVAKDITKDIELNILNERAINWINNKPCKAYIERYKDTIIKIDDQKSSFIENSENGILSKDDISNQLILLIGKVNEPKLKSELLIKLADIRGYKKQDQTKQEEQIKYYLPLRCESCDFKNTKINI